MARRDGVPAAKKDILKIGQDPRVPMAQVYDLFAGKGDAATVLSAARVGDPQEEQLKVRLFYAHLYLGLYFDALGESDKALEHMRLAAQDYFVNDYMGGVAAVHLAVLENANKKEP